MDSATETKTYEQLLVELATYLESARACCDQLEAQTAGPVAYEWRTLESNLYKTEEKVRAKL